MLACKSRQLTHADEVLEGVGKRHCANALEELFHCDFFAGLIAHGVHLIRREIVAREVFLHEGVHFRLGDCIHLVYEFAHRPGVDLPAELSLRFDFVAFGDGYLAHVVAKADKAQVLALIITDRAAHPRAELVEYRRILPVSRDDLARESHSRRDEAVLAVAVRCLIEVHEIHVDFLIRNLAVILRRKMAVRLLQQLQTVDPHLAGAEGVHPGHDATAGVAIVGFFDKLLDFVRGLHRSFIEKTAGNLLLRIDIRCHLLAALVYRLQHFRPV